MRNNILRCRWFLWSVRKFALFDIYVCHAHLPVPPETETESRCRKIRKIHCCHRFNGLAQSYYIIVYVSRYISLLYPFQLLLIWLFEPLESTWYASSPSYFRLEAMQSLNLFVGNASRLDLMLISISLLSTDNTFVGALQWLQLNDKTG